MRQCSAPPKERHRVALGREIAELDGYIFVTARVRSRPAFRAKEDALDYAYAEDPIADQLLISSATEHRSRQEQSERVPHSFLQRDCRWSR